MKNRTKIISFLFITAFGLLVATAQDLVVGDYDDTSYSLLIPKLNVLIDSALVNNGMVSYRLLEIEAKEANLKSKKNYWTRNVGIQADTRYGTFDNYSTITGDKSSINLASDTQQMNYNVGVYLKFPIFDVVNRKAQIKKAKVEIEQAKRLVQFQKDEIIEKVIRYYQDLILKQNLLELKASNQGSARVNMEMVEKGFRNG